MENLNIHIKFLRNINEFYYVKEMVMQKYKKKLLYINKILQWNNDIF